jgi:hypothetical protein
VTGFEFSHCQDFCPYAFLHADPLLPRQAPLVDFKNGRCGKMKEKIARRGPGAFHRQLMEEQFLLRCAKLRQGESLATDIARVV